MHPSTRHARLATLPAPFVVIVLALGALAVLSWVVLAPGTLRTLARSVAVGWTPERWGAAGCASAARLGYRLSEW